MKLAAGARPRPATWWQEQAAAAFPGYPCGLLALPRYRILVCRGPECGGKRGSSALLPHLQRALADEGVADRCDLRWQSCFGRCSLGPNVLVRELSPAPEQPRYVFATLPGRGGKSALYNRVSPDRLREIVRQHVGQGEVVRGYIERGPATTSAQTEMSEPKEPGEN